MRRFAMPLVAGLLWVLASCCAYTASAYDLGCQFDWAGPSSQNDVPECLENYPSRYPGLLIPTAIPLVFGLFLLFCFPVTFFGRCCGMCGSNNQRPSAGCCCDGREWDFATDDEKTRAYHTIPRHLYCVKFFAVLLFIVSGAAVVLMPVGAGLALEGWNYAIDHVETDVLQWIQTKTDDLMEALRDSSGELPPPLDNDSFSMLTDTLAECRNFNDDLRSATDKWVDAIIFASFGLASIPAIGMLCVMLFALCSCRKFLPACFQCIFYPCGLLFSLVSAVFLSAGLILIIAHGEAELQENAQPGLFGWYLVPYCESEFNFQNAKDVVNEAIATAAHDGCEKILEICDDAPTIIDPTSTAEKQFYCPTLSNGDLTQLCQTTADLRYFFNNTFAKDGSWICADVSNGGPPYTYQNCSIAECPDMCIVPAVQDEARDASNQLASGERSTKALAKAFLFADCDILLAQFVKPLQKIDLGGSGFYAAGAGACVGALCFMLGIMMLFKGQKVFVSPPKDVPY